MKMALAKLKIVTLTVHIIIYDKYGVDPTETWIYGDWFYTTNYSIFGHEVKATKRSPPDNLTRWIIAQSKVLQKKVLKR